MSKRSPSYHPSLAASWIKTRFAEFWHKNIWHKLLVIFSIIILLVFICMYGIAQWYIRSQKDKPLVIGTSFIPAYAESFGLDPEDTMDALLNDLGVRHFRLVSYWNQLEPEEGKYDFTLLDWQFKKAEAHDATITLSLGLRQPRWPECHMPTWAQNTPEDVWQPKLERFMTEVVNRYKDSPALESYQIENEFFLKGFGICTNHNRDRLIREYELVNRLDPHNKIIINRSNNLLGWPVNEPTPDEFGISIYKRVWDDKLTNRYLEYPFPAWLYASVAGWQQIMTGRGMMLHELQAEAWPPQYQSMQQASLEEQSKSFDAGIFRHRIEFGKATGIREIYLWGSEYWYYRKVKLNDPSVWNVARDIYRNNSQE